MAARHGIHGRRTLSTDSPFCKVSNHISGEVNHLRYDSILIKHENHTSNKHDLEHLFQALAERICNSN